MDTPHEDIDEEVMQEAINAKARRPSNKRTKNPKPISAKNRATNGANKRSFT